MAEPRRDPETGGRSLAEILREAGIESPTRGRRRREDGDDTGIRQRGADPAPSGDTGRVGGRPYGRRASDLRVAGSPSPAAAPSAPPSGARAADPSTAAIPGMRPSGKPEVPGATAETGVVRRPEERRTERRPDERRAPDRRPDDRRAGDRRVANVPVAEDRRVADRRQGDRRLDDRRRADEPRSDERRAASPAADAPAAGERRRARVPEPAAPLDDNPRTGPIPVVRDDAAEDQDAAPQEGALAWLRFAGELVVALAAGVAIYFLFTAIWENLPYLAVVLAPLAVTGLVAGVGAYRHKMSRGPVGPRLLAVLVFAGALLTMWPAANLLSIG